MSSTYFLVNTASSGASNLLTIHAGLGDGNFFLTPYTRVLDAGQSLSGTTLDYNGDGIMDVLLANYFTGVSYIEQGTGDFNFLTNAQVLVNSGDINALPAAATDLNGDAVEDLVLTYFTEAFCPQLGTASGNFSLSPCYPEGNRSYTPNLADLNGDGLQDLAFASNSPSGLGLALGGGDGTFRNFACLPVGGVHAGSAVGDFNHDGRPDAALTSTDANTTNGAVSIFLQSGCN